jgi:hypothetical protein
MLTLHVAEIHVERVVQNVDVPLKPSREVVRLVPPDFPQRHPLDLADLQQIADLRRHGNRACRRLLAERCVAIFHDGKAYAASRSAARLHTGQHATDLVRIG